MEIYSPPLPCLAIIASQIRTIQTFQSISLRQITSAPWYVSNQSNLSLHKDLKIETISKTAAKI